MGGEQSSGMHVKWGDGGDLVPAGLYLHVVRIESRGARGNVLLPQARDVPHPDSLVEGGRHNEVL